MSRGRQFGGVPPEGAFRHDVRLRPMYPCIVELELELELVRIRLNHRRAYKYGAGHPPYAIILYLALRSDYKFDLRASPGEDGFDVLVLFP